MLSFFWQFEKFGTGKGLLWYRKFTRCPKRLPGVRGAFSGALGAQNRLLWYGRDIRYRKSPPAVRGVHLHSEALGTGNALLRYGVHLQSAVPS